MADYTQSCEEYYGPYPKAPPVAFYSSSNEGREGVTPSEEEIANAKGNVLDLPKDYRDKGTPDEWVPRDGRMVRLTGKHPFNAEPPLECLDSFITPSSLHIVRNHSACPKLTWEGHTLKIGGPLAPNPMELSMDELTTKPSKEFACTISCCGNRRKEANMIRQTIGFNWGAAAVGTNVYKGATIRDLLLEAGVSTDNMHEKYVEFVGYEDLPNKGAEGPFEEKWPEQVKYGTSIPLGKAMDPANDIIIAYQANGERLLPDHGFPCRLVLPGYIGGRMIKWLDCINVIPHESRNHYHYHDNKMLPPQITAEEAMKDGWWYKQEYIINYLSLNSVICKPDHKTTLSIADSINGTYRVSGYAHAGNGSKVLRVEFSVDKGVTWEVTEITRKERPNEYGKYWCWVWWHYDMKVADLVGCEEMWVRAWDEGLSPQPSEATWSLMGQQLNHIFRIKVHTDETAAGEPVFRFEHPTQPGQQTGGWATRTSEKFTSAGYGRIDLGEASQ